MPTTSPRAWVPGQTVRVTLPEWVTWATGALLGNRNNSSLLLVLVPGCAVFKEGWNSPWHCLSDGWDICLFFPQETVQSVCAPKSIITFPTSPSLACPWAAPCGHLPNSTPRSSARQGSINGSRFPDLLSTFQLLPSSGLLSTPWQASPTSNWTPLFLNLLYTQTHHCLSAPAPTAPLRAVRVMQAPLPPQPTPNSERHWQLDQIVFLSCTWCTATQGSRGSVKINEKWLTPAEKSCS